MGGIWGTGTNLARFQLSPRSLPPAAVTRMTPRRGSVPINKALAAPPPEGHVDGSSIAETLERDQSFGDRARLPALS